jgi:hypothetical protein
MNYSQYSPDLWSPGGSQGDRLETSQSQQDQMRRMFGAGGSQVAASQYAANAAAVAAASQHPVSASKSPHTVPLPIEHSILNILKDCMTELRHLKSSIARIDGEVARLDAGMLFPSTPPPPPFLQPPQSFQASMTSFDQKLLVVVCIFFSIVLILLVLLVVAVLMVALRQQAQAHFQTPVQTPVQYYQAQTRAQPPPRLPVPPPFDLPTWQW